MGQGPKWTTAQREARLQKLLDRNRSTRQDFKYEDAEWLREAYVERRLTLREVARETGCSLRTIARWMAIHSIPTRKDALVRRRRGAEHPGWKGGRPKCPVCGGPRSYGTRTRTCFDCRDISGPKSGSWQGDEIEYTAAHARVVSQRGAPSAYPCAHCQGIAQEWAYDHADPNEKRNQHGRDEGPYSLDPNHYLPLCVRCHRKLDNGRRGHRTNAFTSTPAFSRS